MSIHILESIPKDRIYCAGSFTKLLTTYVSLSFLAEKYTIEDCVDEEDFLDTITMTPEAKAFLGLFQRLIGSRFSIRDLCSYYSGLPYTFDLAEEELESVELGNPFKHHSILEEKTFLHRCHHNITPVYANRSKFHYSEIAILFLGYFLEKNFSVNMEDLYQRYVIDKFHLKSSQFSRKMVPSVYCQDLSEEYDYPSIAILDHGYFSYSNGYYTTLEDMKTLIANLLTQPVFACMTDITKARAASNRLLNGMAVEIRLVGDDIIYGYEGLSFSGCNLWAYSTKKKQGFISFSNNEETIYTDVYDDQLGYSEFDKVPDYTQTFYQDFLKQYHFNLENKAIPAEYRGEYIRVNINEKTLLKHFTVGEDFIIIRNPEMIRYDIVYANEHYCIKNKDGVHGGKVEFYTAKSGNRYMAYDGTLYRKR